MQTKLDENLYSRQLYVLGTDAMQSFQTSSVLIMGMSGLGQEIAKNIILAGIHKVHIHDLTLVTIKDLGAGFFLTKENLNHRRDHSVLKKMKELNPYVDVSVVDNINSMEYTTVIVTNKSYKELLNFNSNSFFICCQVNGLFSQVFTDFKKFIIKDENGEPNLQGTINDVTDNVLTVIDEERHNMENNKIKIYKHNSDEIYECYVEAINYKSVKLLNYTGGNFNGGTYEEIKVPKQMEYKNLENSLTNPQILNCDSKSKIIHNCYYLYTKGKDLLRDYQEKLEELPFNVYSEELIKTFEYMYDIEIMPMVSVIGGFVAQEALKSCSGRFTPLNQYFYFDSLQCLNYDDKNTDENIKTLDNQNTERENLTSFETSNFEYLKQYVDSQPKICESRYYSYEKLFREKFYDIKKSKIFVIGAGAIGCEHLKNIVMSGMGVDGRIFLTDMDSIEQSNLNRQFLFRQWDVTKMKSEIAAREAEKMNSDYQIIKHENDENTIQGYNLKVGTTTENIFSDKFYGNLTLVANALDNIDARLYVDSRCVLNCVPSFESGTLGTKGNTQVILPHRTESYSSSSDPPEKSIPMCTLRNFPHLIEHTIEFALSEFQSNFNDKIVSIKDFFTKEDHESVKEDNIGEDIIEIINNLPKNEDNLLSNSFDLFYKTFYVSILKLLNAFPVDSKTKEGVPFWTPPKRAPEAITFDTKNEVHLLFINSCCSLYAKVFQIENSIDDEKIIDYFNAHANDLLVKAESKLQTKDEKDDDKSEIKEFFSDDKRSLTFEPIEFEKDDDTNHHIDFIFACANIRAENYKIKEASKLQVKGIAGKIIPAIATTTAMISGLSVLEMYKYILKCKFESFRNTYLTLALPMITSSEPLEPMEKEIKIDNFELKKYTLWDKIEFEDMSLQVFINMFREKYQLEITMLSCNGVLVYCSFYQQSKYEKNLSKNFKTLSNADEGVKYTCLDCLFSDEDIEMPTLVIKFN